MMLAKANNFVFSHQAYSVLVTPVLAWVLWGAEAKMNKGEFYEEKHQMRKNGERTGKSDRNLTPCRGWMEAKLTGSVLGCGGVGSRRKVCLVKPVRHQTTPPRLRTEPAFIPQLVSSSRMSHLLVSDYYTVAQMGYIPLRSYQLLTNSLFWGGDIYMTI